MFIVMTGRVWLTPSGVKCNDVVSGTWNSWRSSLVRRLRCYKHGTPDGVPRVAPPQLSDLQLTTTWSHTQPMPTNSLASRFPLQIAQGAKSNSLDFLGIEDPTNVRVFREQLVFGSPIFPRISDVFDLVSRH